MARVLIVEDDPDVREMMELFVQTSGHNAVSAENGLLALEAMRQQDPCMILLDLHMPVMDGFEFRQRQLADPRLAKIPVLCVTAAFDPGRITRELGVPCMGKPVRFEDIRKSITQFCGSAR